MQKGRVTLRVAGGIPYELTRKKVKYFNLHVRRDGSVALSSPLRISPEAADHYIIGQLNCKMKKSLPSPHTLKYMLSPDVGSIKQPGTGASDSSKTLLSTNVNFGIMSR